LDRRRAFQTTNKESMPNLADFGDEMNGLFGLFKGDSGAGKSVAALSFPNCYLFDFDRKMPGVALKHFRGRTDISWDAMKTIYDCADKITEFQSYCPHETLIFDSVTHLSTMCLNAIGEAKSEKVVDMLRKLTAKGKSIELMGVDYYNGETNFLVRYFLDAIRGLYVQPGNPKHIILIAHVLTTESAPDLKTKIITRSSSIVTAGKKVAAVIPSVFDDMYHFALKHDDQDLNSTQMRRVALTSAHGEEFAKSSYNLPPMIDFTNGSFYDQMCKYVTFRKD
jgi:hypothetical protein